MDMGKRLSSKLGYCVNLSSGMFANDLSLVIQLPSGSLYISGVALSDIGIYMIFECRGILTIFSLEMQKYLPRGCRKQTRPIDITTTIVQNHAHFSCMNGAGP